MTSYRQNVTKCHAHILIGCTCITHVVQHAIAIAQCQRTHTTCSVCFLHTYQLFIEGCVLGGGERGPVILLTMLSSSGDIKLYRELNN